MASAAVLLLDLYLAGGTHHDATCHYGSAQLRNLPNYLSRIERWSLSQELPDPLLGGAFAKRKASVTLSDVDLGRESAPTLAAILATENPKGKRARARTYYPDTGAIGATIEGYISSIGQDYKTLEIEGEDPALLLTELPKRQVLKFFTSAETVNSTSRDPRVIIPFGPMPRVDLSLVHATYLTVTATMAGGGNQYGYYELTHVPGVTIAAGDTLVYDVQWDQDNAQIALDLGCTDTTVLRATAAVDQNDLSAHPNTPLPTGATAPNRKWYRREILLTDLVGKFCHQFLVACENDTPGTYTGRIAKAFIIDANGAIKVTIHDEHYGSITTALNGRSSTSVSITITRAAVWDWGPIRRPGGAGTALAYVVYRDGLINAGSEWSAINFYDFTLIRFLNDCRDSSGRRMRVQADLDSTEFSRNPAKVYEFFWSDLTDGLGQAVNATSFTAAEAIYAAVALNKLAGGLSGAVPARKLFSDLAVRGEYFELNTAGEITITVDQGILHPLSTLILGQRDDTMRRNAQLVNNSGLTRATTDQVKGVDLLAYNDPGLDGNPTWLITARRERAVGGKVETIEKPYCGTGIMADRVCDYLFKLLTSFDEDIEVEVGSLGQQFALGERAEITAPQYYLNLHQMSIRRLAQEANRFRLRLVGYVSTLWTYVKGEVTVSPLVNTRTDFSRTPPNTPTSFAFISATLGETGDGVKYSIERYQATLPASNCTAMVLRAYRVGQTALFREVVRTPITLGASTPIEIVMPIGGSFDMECYAFNTMNDPEARYSIAATISGHLVGGDTTPPPQVVGLVLSDHPPRGLRARWTSLKPGTADLSHYEVEYDTDSGFGSPISLRANTTEMLLASLANGTTYFVRVRGKDLSGNPTANTGWSATVSRLVPRIDGNDLNDGIVTTVKIGLAQITSALIANAQINNAHITGLMTVSPVGEGMTGLLIKNSGSIRLQNVQTTPSRVVFESSSSVEQGSISGTTGQVWIQPASNNINTLYLGHPTRRWNVVDLYGGTLGIFGTDSIGLITDALSLSPSSSLHVNGSWVRNVAAGATDAPFSLTIRNTAGTIIGYIPMKTT